MRTEHGAKMLDRHQHLSARRRILALEQGGRRRRPADADAVILADLGLLEDAARRHPELRLHLSVQAAAANADAINFYATHVWRQDAWCCRAC